MSDTPRTDAARISAWGEGGIENSIGFSAIPVEFARQLERELAEAKAEIVRLRELLEHAMGTDTPENNEQTDNERMHLSPVERRAAGQPHCPICYTFGNSHRNGCKYANDGMDNHIRSKG